MQFIDLKRQYEVLKDEIDASVADVLNDAHYIGGKEVGELSADLAKYAGVKHCLTCANGTDALTLALRCLDVKEGDAVFVPDFTFFATAEVVALEKATNVFVDVNERTFNMSPESLEEAVKTVIKEGKLNPKAIIAVDLFGQPADFISIRKIANKYNLKVIEDGAQGFGGSINGKRACSFGDISTTSFFPAKPLGCYGGIGYNSRLDTIQAAILKVKLKAFVEYELDKRNEFAKYYTEKLKEKYLTPVVPETFLSSWAQYTLILNSNEERQRIQSLMKDRGIPTMVYYPIPMHMETAFKGLKVYVSLLNSEKLSKTVMSIPMHPYLTYELQNKVIDAMK